MELSYEILVLLLAAGLLAGFVDSIAGGGGLISLPALLAVGLPPHIALGTNKLQGTFGVCTAAINYVRKGKVDFKECGLGIFTVLTGSAMGALTIQWLDPQFIAKLVPVLLFLVLIYTVFSKNLGGEDGKAKLPVPIFYLCFGLILGFYNGFFGPGTGAFWTASLLFLLGYNFTKSIGVTKIMNATGNLIALLVFVVSGNINVFAGLTMALGQVIGARIGSNLAIHSGARFIRPFFLLVVLLTIVRLVYNNYV